VAGVERRLAEAAAALATLDEAVARASGSLIARDSAILRLIYTFEAMWKASQHILAERENVEVASPNGTIRAARRLGWFSDEDAQAAIEIGRDRNLAVHMYRGKIGEEIEQRLAAHAALLHRRLDALTERAASEG
jgi:Nucleotidyltransferase substrate binding protein like